MIGLVLFAGVHIDTAGPMQLFLVAMEAVIVGLHFAYWAMLPNTIEYGERATGLRVEGAVFGMASLLQRMRDRPCHCAAQPLGLTRPAMSPMSGRARATDQPRCG